MRRKWTEDEDDFLKFAFEKKISLSEMEEALDGRTKIAIKGRIVALGLKRNFPPREKDGLIRCSHCGEYKTKDNFLRLKTEEEKYYCYCNACKTKLNKEKYLKKKKERYLSQIDKTEKTKLEVNNNLETKVCSKCNETKSVNEFPWSVKGEKLSSMCKDCRKEVNKKYQQDRLRKKGF